MEKEKKGEKEDNAAVAINSITEVISMHSCL